jgi:predicted negative regulator of RcsB-dependent stress response
MQPPPAVEAMRTYIDLVMTYSRMSRDPSTAGVAAVIAATDILKPRGAQAAIDYFNGALKDVKNATVQRAIHGQLAELYKQSGQADKALDELKTLMTGAPAGEPQGGAAGPGGPPTDR